jgi:hypothetical protein
MGVRTLTTYRVSPLPYYPDAEVDSEPTCTVYDFSPLTTNENERPSEPCDYAAKLPGAQYCTHWCDS